MTLDPTGVIGRTGTLGPTGVVSPSGVIGPTADSRATRPLLLAPHQDDETLWASFLICAHDPDIIVVLRGDDPARVDETRLAVKALGGRKPRQWAHRAEDPDWALIALDLRALANTGAPYHRVFAPLPEPNGHPQHNRVGELAVETFGAERVTFYTTYRYGGPRTLGDPVPYERDWVARKLMALSCHRSQILSGPVRFFTMPLDEYTRQP